MEALRALTHPPYPAAVGRRNAPADGDGTGLPAADGPGLGAPGREQRGGDAVLLGLGGGGGVAGAAVLPPGRAGELVLPAVLAGRGDGGGVAGGLALGDLGQRGVGRGAAATARGGLRGGTGGRACEAEVRQRDRAGDAVDGEALVALVVAHGAAGGRAVDAVGRDAERALERGDGCARAPHRARARAGALRERASGGERQGRGGDERAGAATTVAAAGLARLGAASPRAALGFEPRDVVRQICVGHSGETPWFLVPTGLAVGLALGTALRRALAAIRPVGPHAAPSGSPVPSGSSGRDSARFCSYGARDLSDPT